jgi:hypothetical protein
MSESLRVAAAGACRGAGYAVTGRNDATVLAFPNTTACRWPARCWGGHSLNGFLYDLQIQGGGNFFFFDFTVSQGWP